MEGRPLDEHLLVQRARNGDVAAYERLVEAHQAPAFRVAFVILGDAAEAEDATQEAFIRAFAALGRFRPGAPLRPWLLRIAANEARNRRKASRRRASLALRAAEERPSGDAAPSPEAAVLERERRRALLAAVEGLRDEDRLVVTCRYFLDLGEAEMAAVLRCPRGTVKSRLSRALARLRESLGSSWPGGEHG